MVPGIAVSSFPWETVACVSHLCRIRLCPPGPARRQQARLQVDRKKLPEEPDESWLTAKEVNGAPAEAVEGRGQGRGAPRAGLRGAAGWGAALAAGEQAGLLGEGPGRTWPPGTVGTSTAL